MRTKFIDKKFQLKNDKVKKQITIIKIKTKVNIKIKF